jgi:hypothetical protein
MLEWLGRPFAKNWQTNHLWPRHVRHLGAWLELPTLNFGDQPDKRLAMHNQIVASGLGNFEEDLNLGRGCEIF